MTLAGALENLGERRLTRRRVAWGGALFIAAIFAVAVYDIVRGYRAVVDDTGRELETQARIIAEQTARSVHAVDIVLRHIAGEYRRGRLSQLDAPALHAYLRDQAVGLVQIDGFALHDTRGNALAISWLAPGVAASVLAMPAFQALRDGLGNGLLVSAAVRSPSDGQWVFPIGRRLETQSGAFAGIIGARGRIDYFQQFYRDVQLDPGTKVTLMHADGTLLARHPPAPAALGQQFALFDRMRAAQAGGGPDLPLRIVSPIDGGERFGTVRNVPDYPLAVVVTRDVALALAHWRTQAIGTAVLTLALGSLAALLLAMVMGQLTRLVVARESLEASKERFALAVAGSDDGVWDWDYKTGLAFDSPRSRELLALPPAPELQPIDDMLKSLHVHPEDAPRRAESIRAHLAGETPAYECEYRVRHDDGSYRWVRIRAMCVRDADGKPVRMAGSVSDIDARKRAEEALRLSEERYAIAMTGSDEAHWVWNVKTDELYASPQLRRLTGVADDARLVRRSEWVAILPIHPEDAPRLQQGADDHLAGRTPRFDVEYRVVDRDTQAVRWLHTRGQCFRDAKGQPERMAGSTVEITQRKRAEQALRESEQRHQLAVEGANDGILDWDIVADRMFASERAMRLLGLAPDGALRTRAQWAELVMPRFHPDDAQRLSDELRGTADSPADTHEGEYRALGSDGVYRWLRFRGRTVRDAQGRAIRWAGSVSDVDALKKAEQALRESDQRYQLAVAGSNQGLWDWDLLTDTVFFSARAQQLIGDTPGQALRPRREWLARWACHPDDLPRVRQALADYLRGTARLWEVEYRLRYGSTQWHWYRDRGVALRDAAGRPYRMAGSLEDITDRKLAQAEREQLEGQLRQAQKLEAIGTLAGGIAHDFNNILAAILGYGEMAQRNAAEGTPLRRHIDAALSAAMRAKSLVERILAFSRSGMGERVPVHVQSVVEEALEQIAASLPPGITLERELAAGNAAVFGDPTQIHQVVLNLCANAVHAMPQGGTLKVSAHNVQLEQARVCTTSRLEAGAYLRLVVGDSGVGIAPRVLERIFDPFFTTKEIGVGTGLGLSLVHGIVTDLAGGIDVHSELGGGTTLTVYLPWSSCVAPAVAVEQPVARGTGETVLLVDDEHALVALGEEMMAQLGYEPIGFASSTAALESLRATPLRFDLVLTDEAMPEMTGSELAREIRKIRPDIPIVLMSGYVTPALTARARELGITEVLPKPLVQSDMARGLASALQRHPAA